MKNEALINLEIMSQTDNYNKWLYHTIRHFLGNRILEIGCGIGNMSQFFINNELLVGIDNSLDCIRITSARFPRRENLAFLNYDICNNKILELKKYDFDTIICINVLEHLKDDLLALANCHQLLTSQGKLVIIVPALKFLYGTIDQADGHWRRYNRKELLHKLNLTNFYLEKSFFINLAGILIWFWHSKIKQKSIHPQKQMIFLDRFIPLYTVWEKILSPPIGLNLAAICKKVKK